VLQDQYGNNVDQPYAVERFMAAVQAYTGVNRNPRDGAMLWSINKDTSGSCAGKAVASPSTIGKQIADQLALPYDPSLANPGPR
jgi:hypothetical protein